VTTTPDPQTSPSESGDDPNSVEQAILLFASDHIHFRKLIGYVSEDAAGIAAGVQSAEESFERALWAEMPPEAIGMWVMTECDVIAEGSTTPGKGYMIDVIFTKPLPNIPARLRWFHDLTTGQWGANDMTNVEGFPTWMSEA
jgi:hypothetical protein